MATSTIRYQYGRIAKTIPTTTSLAEILRATLPTGPKLVIGTLSWSNNPPYQVQLINANANRPLTEVATRVNASQSELSVFGVTDSTEVILYGSSVSAGNNLARIVFMPL